MPISLKKQFTGKESEIIGAVKEYGIDTARAMFKVRHRKTFLHWLKENTSENWQPNPLETVKGVQRGGDKIRFNHEHRQTILDCLEIFGTEWTMANFHLKADTLDRLVRFDHHSFTGYSKRLTKLERMEFDLKEALARIKELEHRADVQDTKSDIIGGDNRDLKFGQNELGEAFQNLAETTARQISEGLIVPLTQYVLRTPEQVKALELTDLSLEHLQSQARKQLGQGVEASPAAMETIGDNHKKEDSQKLNEIIANLALDQNPLLSTIARSKLNAGGE